MKSFRHQLLMQSKDGPLSMQRHKRILYLFFSLFLGLKWWSAKVFFILTCGLWLHLIYFLTALCLQVQRSKLKWCLFLNMHLFLVANTGRERCCSLKAELYKESDKNRIAYDEWWKLDLDLIIGKFILGLSWWESCLGGEEWLKMNHFSKHLRAAKRKHKL